MLSERLGREAASALSALWAGAGFFEDNRRLDHHGFGVPAAHSGDEPPEKAASDAEPAIGHEASAAGLPDVPAGPVAGESGALHVEGAPERGNDDASERDPDQAIPGEDKGNSLGETAAADQTQQENSGSSEPVPFSLTTVRALEALVDLAALRPRWMSDGMRELLVTTMLPVLLRFDPSRPDPIHPAGDEQESQLGLLRIAALTTALDKTTSWRPRRDDLNEDGRQALKRLQERVTARLAEIGTGLVAAVRELDDQEAQHLHPYVAYATITALRALVERGELGPVDANEAQDALTTIWEPSRGNLERLLARHSIGLVNANEAVAVALYAGCAAAAGPSAQRHLHAAVDAAVDDRFAFGGWHQGRVVAQQQRADHATVTLTVPTFEVSRVLAEVIARGLDDPIEDVDRIPSASAVIDGLAAAIRSVEASRVEAKGVSGWPGEQIVETLLVEASPTAAVLGLCVAVSEIADASERRQLLRELAAFPSWGEDWPDYLEWKDYVTANEPEQEAKILAFIDEVVVQPRVNRRPGASTDATVVLLFGPPGTTKTTIARAVASGLRWPVVQLSPGNFIEEGLERIEQRAEFYFERLQALYRTVVIMDECDELFRRRRPEDVSDAVRQVSAFMTASMLPKLQDLHDRSRIVLFICTNFLTSIDPAIKRVGRVDHLIAVAPPDAAQRKHTIQLAAGRRSDNEQQQLLEIAIDKLTEETEDFIRGELVAAGRELKAINSFSDSPHAVRVARDIAARMKPAMTISRDDVHMKQEFERFERDGKAISQPHRNAKAREEA